VGPSNAASERVIVRTVVLTEPPDEASEAKSCRPDVGRGRGAHAWLVQMPGHVAGDAAALRQPHGPRVEQVAIELGSGALSRVEGWRRTAAVDDADVVGHEPIEGPGQVLRRHGPAQVERRHLAQRVDAGIGAAGPGHRHAAAVAQAAQGLLQHALHGAGAARLRLPSLEVGPVVGEGDAIEAHVRARGQRPAAAREPGISGWDPRAHRGQVAGG
jgi:hypothetical protein